MKWMALENALDPKPGALECAVALDRLIGIARARRLEPTLGEDEVGQRELVATDESHYGQARRAFQARHVSVSTTPVNSARSTAKEAL